MYRAAPREHDSRALSQLQRTHKTRVLGNAKWKSAGTPQSQMRDWEPLYGCSPVEGARAAADGYEDGKAAQQLQAEQGSKCVIPFRSWVVAPSSFMSRSSHFLMWLCRWLWELRVWLLSTTIPRAKVVIPMSQGYWHTCTETLTTFHGNLLAMIENRPFRVKVMQGRGWLMNYFGQALSLR